MREILTWLPAIILPASTTIQLTNIYKTRSSEGVSALTWFLFGLANIGAYVLTEKYFAIQSILAFLLTAVLDFIIVYAVFKYQKS
ncbi:MAG TPA: hypothetical protein QGF08_07045 [Candidatus Marinimicrobia bacterium]|jgi:hypothetical protein|nr:hypothetical protein [Candidatus Neomarinimicrobiota bacterium]MDP7216677.1 hypothetical protein [Candidatus Neomarinimicrobiota bacterium]HJL74511.1 hypothetical protein [Candidatus Neomarinimicrobiota bacterium]HJM70623.1 hypothetical protein [Candidatus Neomarinimicrobiota bacterium]|tara:strand:- start:3786 stop:4040 length:255 start_codon:yes stop_codon:yes gene_type:complete